MTDRGEAARRSPRPPLARQARRRWVVVAGAAACWLLLLAVTGSIVAATGLFLFIGALGVVAVMALRAMGVTGAHPWVQALRSRPWRGGQEVLRLALGHLPEVFVTTPAGSLLAPNSVEVWLSERDFASLCEQMDPHLVNVSATEVYHEEVAAHGAWFGRPDPAEVRVIGHPSVSPGRYRLRPGRPLDSGFGAAPQPGYQSAADGPQPMGGTPLAAQPVPSQGNAPLPQRAPRAGDWPFTGDGPASGEPAADATVIPPTVMPPTVAEQSPVPVLRLVTGEAVAQARTPSARAGRGQVELVLPQVPTVSREHARFTYADGQWWVENLGRNGLTLNGVPLEGQRPVHDGDSIRWGTAADALVSRVQIG